MALIQGPKKHDFVSQLTGSFWQTTMEALSHEDRLSSMEDLLGNVIVRTKGLETEIKSLRAEKEVEKQEREVLLARNAVLEASNQNLATRMAALEAGLKNAAWSYASFPETSPT